MWCIMSIVMPLVPSWMEDTMCWELDHLYWVEQRKARESQQKQEQRAGVIGQLLNEANKQAEAIDAAKLPVTEIAPTTK